MIVSGEVARISDVPPNTEPDSPIDTYGISTEDLKRYQSLLGMNEEPVRRRILMKTLAKKKGIDPELLHRIVRLYAKEAVEKNENGPLFHYHATSREALEGICQQGALLPYNDLKAKGKPPKSTGSRPDVVQCTRDQYDAQGRLVKKGLGQYPDEITLVISPSVMGERDYDCLSSYPNLPKIPFSKVERVLVGGSDDISTTQQLLQRYGFMTAIETREQWANIHYGQEGY